MGRGRATDSESRFPTGWAPPRKRTAPSHWIIALATLKGFSLVRACPGVRDDCDPEVVGLEPR